jgi:hypothetical protein
MTDLLSWRPPEPCDVRGSTFNPERDAKRLNAQTQRVHDLMIDGNWRGLAQIAAATGDPEASVSARLRDLRRFGFTVERRYIANGLWEYRTVKP